MVASFYLFSDFSLVFNAFIRIVFSICSFCFVYITIH